MAKRANKSTESIEPKVGASVTSKESLRAPLSAQRDLKSCNDIGNIGISANNALNIAGERSRKKRKRSKQRSAPVASEPGQPAVQAIEAKKRSKRNNRKGKKDHSRISASGGSNITDINIMGEFHSFDLPVKAPNIKLTDAGTQTESHSTVTHALLKVINCEICLDVLAVPHITECGHSYCYNCIHTWASREGSNQTCPSCRKSLLTKPAVNHTLQNCISLIVAQMEESEKIAAIKRLEDAETAFRKMGDPWPDWSTSKPRWAYDAADDVNRCMECGCEIEDNYCENCDHFFDNMDEDAERGNYETIWGDDFDDSDGNIYTYSHFPHYAGIDSESSRHSPPPYIDNYSIEPGYTTNYIDIEVESEDSYESDFIDDSAISSVVRSSRTARPIFLDTDSESSDYNE